MASSSSSGSSKRAKAPGNITHIVSCLVDGCHSDLSQYKEYHRKHKVCELHSKTSKVTIGGQEQRFCQQCSRFQSLVEFDEGKRSCRRRLEGHNRRRRKSQSESLPRSTGKFQPNQQGTTMLSFGGEQLLGSIMINSAPAGAVKIEDDDVPFTTHQHLNYIDRDDSYPESSAHSFGGGTHLHSRHVSQSRKMLFDGPSRAVDSDCALSLLSSAPAATREIGSSHAVLPSHIPPAQSLVHSTRYSDICQDYQGMGSKPAGSVLSSHAANNANLHFQGMFQNGPDGSSASGSHHTLSFRWD